MQDTNVTDLFADALRHLWNGANVFSALRAAELLHATAVTITTKVRETGSVADTLPDILEALTEAGITPENLSN